MSYTRAHLTLREWDQHMRTPARVVALVGISFVLTLAAPFDTGQTLPAVARFCYWSLLVWVGYSIGYFGDVIARTWLPSSASLFARSAVAGSATAIGVFGLTLVLHRGFFAEWPDMRLLGFIAANVFAISYVVSGILQYIRQGTPDTQTEFASPPALLARLPFDKRGDLIALSVEDHYVRVITAKGEDMLLMRLSDAMNETAPAKGLQVHRSHWVATRYVSHVERIKDRATLTLRTGQQIPVSRTYLPKIKEAGLL